MNKKIFFILLILIAIFSIASVNATDNMTFNDDNNVLNADEYDPDYYDDEPDAYIAGFFENQSTQRVEHDSIYWYVKNSTVMDEYGEWNFYISTLTLDNTEYNILKVIPTAGVYGHPISVVFNPNEYDVYDGIYYKMDANNRITEIIDSFNYEVIEGEYYHFVGLLGEIWESESRDDYCMVNGECYKFVGTIDPFVVGFFEKAVEGIDYNVRNGKYYTLDGEAIVDFYTHFYGGIDEDAAEDIINGCYFNSDDGIYYRGYAARYAISPFNYIKVNETYYPVMGGKGTYNTTETYGDETYDVEERNRYALIDGKLYPFKYGKLSDLPVNLAKEYKINAPDVTKYFNGPEMFAVTLTDENNRPISNAKVKISLNGRPYARTTNDNGVASMAINLNSGKYDVVTEYGQVKEYSLITVRDTVISNDFTKTFRNETQYYANVVDSNGNALKNTQITINVNGVFYTRTTNEKGIVKMNINLNPGTYVLTAVNPSSGEQHTTRITVLPNIVENHDLTKYYRNASQYRVRLLDDSGNPVGAGVDVIYNINGVFYTRSSDSDGYAKMNINLGAGDYIITAEYKGYRVSNNIKVLPILSANDLKMDYRDGSKFVATLIDGQGRPYSGQTVRFNINGVFYDRVTDENGQARLNINLQAGTYIITSSYNGFNVANTVVIENTYVNPNSGYVYIDIPANADIDLPSEYTTVKKVGIYTIEVHEWRTPGLGEVDIMVYDSNGFVNTYDVESMISDGTRWSSPYSTYEYATYHKWQFSPNVRITSVAVQLLGIHWDGTRS